MDDRVEHVHNARDEISDTIAPTTDEDKDAGDLGSDKRELVQTGPQYAHQVDDQCSGEDKPELEEAGYQLLARGRDFVRYGVVDEWEDWMDGSAGMRLREMV